MRHSVAFGLVFAWLIGVAFGVITTEWKHVRASEPAKESSGLVDAIPSVTDCADAELIARRCNREEVGLITQRETDLTPVRMDYGVVVGGVDCLHCNDPHGEAGQVIKATGPVQAFLIDEQMDTLLKACRRRR